MFNDQMYLKLASPWSRIGATLIDNVISYVMFVIVSLPFGVANTLIQLGSSGNEDFSNLTDLQSLANVGTNLVAGLLSIVAWIVVFIVVPIYVWRGQTLGKKLLNIKIVKLSGEQVEQADILKRYSIPLVLNSFALVPFLCIFACVLPIIALVNLFMLFSDEKRQTLLDKIAGTLVVESN